MRACINQGEWRVMKNRLRSLLRIDPRHSDARDRKAFVLESFVHWMRDIKVS